MAFQKNYFSEEAMHQEGEGTEIVLDLLKQNLNNQQEGE
jgi:hypothetical protein